MIRQHKKIIGIIGGMGPMATCDLFAKVIRLTHANRDQEHLHLIIDNNTDIPDRSAHILNGKKDPVPEIKRAIDKLILDGADVLAMPCNTAHYYYDELFYYAKQKNPKVEFVHMIKETALSCKKEGYKKMLLLATEGTYHTNLYRHIFSPHELEVIYPPNNAKQAIMEAIYAYKKGELVMTGPIKEAIDKSIEEGISAIILGCTELPLIFEGEVFKVPTVDPAVALAKKLAAL